MGQFNASRASDKQCRIYVKIFYIGKSLYGRNFVSYQETYLSSCSEKNPKRVCHAGTP